MEALAWTAWECLPRDEDGYVLTGELTPRDHLVIGEDLAERFAVAVLQPWATYAATGLGLERHQHYAQMFDAATARSWRHRRRTRWAWSWGSRRG